MRPKGLTLWLPRHGLGIIHCDIKPENIVLDDYDTGAVKLIDFGSSCFASDRLSTYVQSRSYRAPEVVLGLEYDALIDVWSLGCVLAEAWSGYVLFQNDSLATMLARLIAILGPIPTRMLDEAPNTHRFFTASGNVYERFAQGQDDLAPGQDAYVLLFPKRTSLANRLHLDHDDLFADFVHALLSVDPNSRPSPATAKLHPFLAPSEPGTT